MRNAMMLALIPIILICYAQLTAGMIPPVSINISSDASAKYTDVFNVTDDVYAQYWETLECPEAWPMPRWADAYVMGDRDNWQNGDSLANYVIKTPVQINEFGKLLNTKIWSHRLKPGNYDIVIDLNQNGMYDHRDADGMHPMPCYEPIDNQTGVGFTVLRPPAGGGSATGGTGSGGKGDHNYTYGEGDPYNEMLQLAVSVTGENMTGINLTLSSSGTGNDKDHISKVDIVWDSNNDGIYQNGTEKLLGSGTYPADNGNLTININSTNIPNEFFATVGKSEYLIIVYEMASSVQSGTTFSFDVTSLWMRGVDSLTDVQIISGYTVKGFTKTISTVAGSEAPKCSIGNCSLCANETSCKSAGCGWCSGDNKCKDVTVVECQPGQSSGSNKYCKSDCSWGTCSGTNANCYSQSGECKACITGEECKNYRCTAFCSGTTAINITLGEKTGTAEIAGLNAGCNNAVAFLKEGSCGGKQTGSCIISSGKCSVNFNMPAAGNHTYAACVDFDNEGDFTDTGESASRTITVEQKLDIILIAAIVIIILAAAGAVFWYMKSKKPKYNVPTTPSYTPPTK